MATPPSSTPRPAAPGQGVQVSVGIGALLLGALLAFGASSIPAAAGYAGVGPNFLPWLVSVVLMVCGAWLIVEAKTGGWRHMEEASGAPQGDWQALAWVAAGIAANAALLTRLGFILSCTLCYMLAVRGLRGSEGKPNGGIKTVVMDFVTGFLIAAPAYWLFTKLLGINLPGLTGTGWL
jgi:putative tricarboxylic transport membrane protein